MKIYEVGGAVRDALLYKKANLDWDQLDIDQSLRPEEVSLENYLKIAKHYQE